MGGIGRGAHLCFTLAIAIGINLILVLLLGTEIPFWYILALLAAEGGLISFGLWLEWRWGSRKSVAEFCKENPWGDPPPPPD